MTRKINCRLQAKALIRLQFETSERMSNENALLFT